MVGFSWIASPAATELESIVMDWLGKLICLPKTFLFSGGGGGVIQGNVTRSFSLSEKIMHALVLVALISVFLVSCFVHFFRRIVIHYI